MTNFIFSFLVLASAQENHCTVDPEKSAQFNEALEVRIKQCALPLKHKVKPENEKQVLAKLDNTDDALNAYLINADRDMAKVFRHNTLLANRLSTCNKYKADLVSTKNLFEKAYKPTCEGYKELMAKVDKTSSYLDAVISAAENSFTTNSKITYEIGRVRLIITEYYKVYLPSRRTASQLQGDQ